MINPGLKSRLILASILSDFNTGKLQECEYVDIQLKRLESFEIMAIARSIDPKLPPRVRSRNRDMAHSTRGLINGIKFAFAVINKPAGYDLIKSEGLEVLKKKI